MKAIVIGATGLVGEQIVNALVRKNEVQEVVVIARRSLGHLSPKVKEHIIDFDHLESARSYIRGDVLFSALGTTIKKAGHKDTQYKIDHDYPFQVAQLARKNGVEKIILISSESANSSSSLFYLRMKGKLEDDIKKLGFKFVTFLRPGPLKGKRNEKRFGEDLMNRLMSIIPMKLVPKRIRPIEGERVAEIAVEESLKHTKKLNILSATDLQDYQFQV